MSLRPGLCIRILKRVSSKQGVPATVGSSPVCQDHAGFEGSSGEPWGLPGGGSEWAVLCECTGHPRSQPSWRAEGEGVSESVTVREAFK